MSGATTRIGPSSQSDLDRRDPFWNNEQRRIIDVISAAYDKLHPAQQQHVRAIEQAFFDWLGGNDSADPRPYIEWTHKVDPTAFVRPRQHLPRMLHRPGELSVDPLPDWWPDEKAYHGSRASWQITHEGLCAPSAEIASGDPEYGWEAVWKDELYNSYRHHLSPEQRRKFNATFGENARAFPKNTFGKLVSLLWVTKSIDEASSYGDVYEVDLSALSYYWWFPDEIAGKGAYVFVMPTDCPQALPSAFKLVMVRARENPIGGTEAKNNIWYHLTDRGRFKLDPNFAPADNAVAIEDRSGRPGIYLGKSVEKWVNGFGYWRPFVVELHVDPSVVDDPGVHGRWGQEMFVTASSFGKLTVERVIPIDAYAREEFGEPGWIESSLGVEFDTGNPIEKRYKGYRYQGPDVRAMPTVDVERLKRQLRQVKGGARENPIGEAKWSYEKLGDALDVIDERYMTEVSQTPKTGQYVWTGNPPRPTDVALYEVWKKMREEKAALYEQSGWTEEEWDRELDRRLDAKLLPPRENPISTRYLYHWTHSDALPSIRQHGLRSDKEGLYTSDDPTSWAAFARVVHGGNVSLLRFPRDAVRPALVEQTMPHAFVVHQTVPVDAVEIQEDGEWYPVTSESMRENPIGGSFPEGPLEQASADFARYSHERVGQKRKYTGDPYIVHPAAVADIVRSVPHDEAMLAAAWLHDTVEDTGVLPGEIRSRFGDDVADLVAWLTDVSKPGDGDRAARKEIDRQHTAVAPPRAQTVKLADLINNSESILAYDPDFAVKYLREKRALLDVMTKGDRTLWNRADRIVTEGLKQLGIGVESKIADVKLTARNEAIVERYGQGTRRVVKVGKLPPEYRQAIAAYWEQSVESVPLDLPVGVTDLPMRAITREIMRDGYRPAEFQGNFERYHQWFMANHGAFTPRHKSRWPVLLALQEDDVEDGTLVDGMHRLNSYYEQGDKMVRAMWIIGFARS